MKRKKIWITALIAIFSISLLIPNIVKAVSNSSNECNISVFEFATKEVHQGEKLYVDLQTKIGKERISKIVGKFLSSTGATMQLELHDIMGDTPYFIIPRDIKVKTGYAMSILDITIDGKTETYYTTKIENSPNFDNSKYINSNGKNYFNTVSGQVASLDNISLKSSSNVTIGEKVYFDLQVKGDISDIALGFYCKEINRKLTVYVRDFKNNPYIDTTNMSTPLTPNEYVFTDVNLIIKHKVGSKVAFDSIHYSNMSTGEDILPLNYDIKINGIDPNATTNPGDLNGTNLLKSISLKSQTAKLNEKVYVDLATNGTAKKVMLSFVDQKNDKNMIVYLKSIDHNPYFVVPYTTDASEYTLDYMVLTDKNMQTHHYRQGDDYNGIKHFDFNSKIQIENAINADNNLIDIDNSKLTNDLIQKIKEMDSNVVITIEASSNPIIKSAVFESIKGSNKIIIVKYNENEWIFNGMDVKTPKDINVSVSITKADQKGSIDVSSMMQKGLVLNYADNGELPAKALVRISATDEMKAYLGNEKAYVYYYDENGNKLDKVAMEISLSDDGYYEFYINHNSSYVITTEKVDSQYISNNTDDLKLNSTLSNDKTDLLNNSGVTQNNQEKTLQIAIVVAVAVIVILIITIIVMISRRKK